MYRAKYKLKRISSGKFLPHFRSTSKLMKPFSITILLVLTFFSGLSAQQKFTLSGYVKDAVNGEELIGVTIYAPALKSGTISNVYGFYSLTLPAGEYELNFSYVGYERTGKTVNLDRNITLNIELNPEVRSMEEIVITDRAIDENVSDLSMSRMRMDIQQVNKLPPLFGEPDIIKTVQLMPGVLVANEGSGAYFVRGGNVDHNLILLDEAPIYDPSHLFGLISVFNSSSIKNSELLKGGIPSMYGGRLASILDVRTKDGNDREFGGEVGVGMLASKILAEGPIIKDKSSFILSGRRSYFDLFLPDDAILKPYFYDLNAKVSFDLNKNNSLFAAFYAGRDRLNLLDGLLDWDWGNETATLRWNHIFNNRLFSNTSLIYSNFDYQNIQALPGFGVDWTANLREYSLKQHFEYYLNPQHTLYFGLNSSYRTFSPGTFVPTDTSSIFQRTELDKQFAWDNALYAGLKQEVTPALSLEYGLRVSAFTKVGKATVYRYEEMEDPAQKVNAAVIDSIHYDHGEVIRNYIRPEPRFSARLSISPSSSLKLSYNRMAQYVHQMVTGSSPLPIAVWQPSGYHIRPQTADQVALGYFRNFRANTYEGSLEVYYKDMNNIIDFRDNANVFFNRHLPREILTGDSYAYGAEFLLRKVSGSLNGWVSYTWSKTIRKIPGINQGRSFFPTYDRRHNATIVATYDLSERISLGATWVYGTGRSQTLPRGSYVFRGQIVDYYTGRNEFRVRDFHRLDLSFTWYSKKKPGRWWESEYNISVYNSYGRRNPYIVLAQPVTDDEGNIVYTYDSDGNLIERKEIRQVNLFGILPSFSYVFKF